MVGCERLPDLRDHASRHVGDGDREVGVTDVDAGDDAGCPGKAYDGAAAPAAGLGLDRVPNAVAEVIDSSCPTTIGQSGVLRVRRRAGPLTVNGFGVCSNAKGNERRTVATGRCRAASPKVLNPKRKRRPLDGGNATPSEKLTRELYPTSTTLATRR